MRIDLDHETLGCIAEAASDVADYATDNDYGYGGDLYEVTRVDNWLEVVRAVIEQLPEPDGKPVLAGSPEQRCRQSILEAFAHATSVQARTAEEVLVLASIEALLAQAVRELDAGWSQGSQEFEL